MQNLEKIFSRSLFRVNQTHFIFNDILSRTYSFSSLWISIEISFKSFPLKILQKNELSLISMQNRDYYWEQTIGTKELHRRWEPYRLIIL